MRQRRTYVLTRAVILMAVLALVAAACGDDDAGVAATPAPATAAPATAAPATAAPATAAPATAAPATAAPATAAPATAAPATAAPVPVEPTDIRFRLNWVADPGFLGYYMAAELGYYEAEGLNVIFEHGGPNTPHPVQVLAGGAADIGAGGFVPIYDGINQGADFVVFGTRLQSQPLGISSLAESPILTAADIVGKRIGGTTGDAAVIDALLVLNGFEAGDYTLVPTGFDPAPVAEGLVDGMVNYMTSHPIILTARGVDNVAVSFGDMGLPGYADMLFAERSWVTENRAALVAFMRATVKGWEAAFADPDAAIDLMMNSWGGADLGLVIDEQRLIHDAQVPLMTSDLTDAKGLFWVDPVLIAGTMYQGLALTGLDFLPEVDDVFDTSILTDVFAGCDGPALLAC